MSTPICDVTLIPSLYLYLMMYCYCNNKLIVDQSKGGGGLTIKFEPIWCKKNFK